MKKCWLFLMGLGMSLACSIVPGDESSIKSSETRDLLKSNISMVCSDPFGMYGKKSPGSIAISFNAETQIATVTLRDAKLLSELEAIDANIFRAPLFDNCTATVGRNQCVFELKVEKELRLFHDRISNMPVLTYQGQHGQLGFSWRFRDKLLTFESGADRKWGGVYPECQSY